VVRPLLNRQEAAAERALKYRALADRPSQRSVCERSDGEPRSWATPGLRSAITLDRATSQPAETERFEGFASVTGQAYEMYDWLGPYDELVAVGAFERTLAQTDLDVPLVLDHTSSRRIARTGNASSPLELSEVTDGERTGLQVVAPGLQLSDPDTAYILPKLRSGLIDEMSFRFMITEGRWSDDFMTYVIRDVDIHRGDVSIVGYGANPHTVGAGMRQKDDGAAKRARERAVAMSLAGDRRIG
jgi:HK97 family phage prohead protease